MKYSHMLSQYFLIITLNNLILQRLTRLQLSLDFKKKNSHYVIKNKFKKNLARKSVKNILNKIL